MLPVIIVAYDDSTRTLYWQHVTEDRIEYTDNGWKILILRTQVVSAAAVAQLRAIAENAVGATEDPMANSLQFLPPSAARVLSQIHAAEPDGTMQLARLLAQGRDQPRLTVETILAARPSWLTAGNGRFEAAIGHTPTSTSFRIWDWRRSAGQLVTSRVMPADCMRSRRFSRWPKGTKPGLGNWCATPKSTATRGFCCQSRKPPLPTMKRVRMRNRHM